MSENKKINLTKKDISKKINLKTGLSNLYTNQITDDFINILKNLIRNKEISIKNFATFKIQMAGPLLVHSKPAPGAHTGAADPFQCGMLNFR